MCGYCKYTIHGKNNHLGWSSSFKPVAFVELNTSVYFECVDSSGGQLSQSSTVESVGGLDFSKINPVTGPVFVEGAMPGDILKVTIEEFMPSGFGWTANIPGFGLLADEFKEPALALWTYEKETLAPAAFGKHGRVPLKPFAGTIGVAPAEAGVHSIVPPRRVGGNLDIRDLSAGSILYLPVEVEGALFSIGDTHAAQGDGEVCGTAIESSMDVVVRFDLIKNTPLKYPRFTTHGPVTSHLDAKGYEVTTGIGSDLMTGAAQAVSEMVNLISSRYNMSPVDAYMLVSTCADLRISEIVDAPNWVVSFYFPRCIFE